MSVDERVDAGGRLHCALDDALVLDVLEIGLERGQHRHRCVLLHIRRPCGRCKCLCQKVGAPSLDLDRLVGAMADDGQHAGDDGGVVSAVAQRERPGRVQLLQCLRTHGGRRGGVGGPRLCTPKRYGDGLLFTRARQSDKQAR